MRSLLGVFSLIILSSCVSPLFTVPYSAYLSLNSFPDESWGWTADEVRAEKDRIFSDFQKTLGKSALQSCDRVCFESIAARIKGINLTDDSVATAQLTVSPITVAGGDDQGGVLARYSISVQRTVKARVECNLTSNEVAATKGLFRRGNTIRLKADGTIVDTAGLFVMRSGATFGKEAADDSATPLSVTDCKIVGLELLYGEGE